jgi:hypothetical protein
VVGASHWVGLEVCRCAGEGKVWNVG